MSDQHQTPEPTEKPKLRWEVRPHDVTLYRDDGTVFGDATQYNGLWSWALKGDLRHDRGLRAAAVTALYKAGTAAGYDVAEVPVDDVIDMQGRPLAVEDLRALLTGASTEAPAALPPHTTNEAGDCVSWCGGCARRRVLGLPPDAMKVPNAR